MITLNTFTQPMKYVQTLPKALKSMPTKQKQPNSTPLYFNNLSFGMRMKIYEPIEFENCRYTGSGKREKFNGGHNVDASGVNFDIEKGFNAGNNFKAQSIKAYQVELGDKAEIEGDIVLGVFGLCAGDRLKANKLISHESDVVIGANADIVEGIVTNCFHAKDGLKTKFISAKGAICLKNVDKLKELYFTKNEPQYSNRLLRLEGEYIKLENDEKIKVYFDDSVNSLYIMTPTGDKSILDKFDFPANRPPISLYGINDNTEQMF